MKKLLMATALCAVLGATPVFAKNMVAQNNVPEGAQKLQAFVGHWTGSGELQQPGQAAVPLHVAINCLKASAGWGIKCDANFKGKGVNLSETDIMGYDAESGHVHWYAITNSGDVHDHIGKWKSDTFFSASQSGHVGGKSEHEDIEIQLLPAGKMKAAATTTLDGERAAFMTLTVSKAVPKAEPKKEEKPKAG